MFGERKTRQPRIHVRIGSVEGSFHAPARLVAHPYPKEVMEERARKLAAEQVAVPQHRSVAERLGQLLGKHGNDAVLLAAQAEAAQTPPARPPVEK